MKAWTVIETSFGSVHSGKTVAIIYSILIINHLTASQICWIEPYLIDQSTTMDIARLKDLTPKVCLTPLNEVPCLLLEHRIFVGDRDELVVTKALRVCNVRKVWVPLLAEFANDQRLVKVVLLQERLGVVVAIDVNLGQSVIHGGILRAGLNSSLQPREDQLQPIPLLDLVD